MSALRAPWHIAVLVGLIAIPILGITAYFTFEIVGQLRFAQNEAAGLRQIVSMDATLHDVARFSQALHCGGFGPSALTQLSEMVDKDFASRSAAQPFPQPQWSSAELAWREVRIERSPSEPTVDDVIDPITKAIVNVSDSSGLTFDQQVNGIDIADALNYRFPQAIAELQSARRVLCDSAGKPTLQERFALASANSRAQTLASDAFDDLDDAVSRGGAPFSNLGTLLHRAQQRQATAHAQLEAFIFSPDSAKAAVSKTSLTDAITGLHGLMLAQVPVLANTLDKRISGNRRRIALAILQGVLSLCAAAIIVFLVLRVLWQRAALEVAQRSAAESEHRATHDPMTGLLNRRAFFAGSGEGMLCVIDVDNLKQINDTYGHLAGDEVLVQIASVVQSAVRSSDTVARLGGDEFAIFLRPPIARPAADRILGGVTQAMSRPIEIRGRTIHTSVSIGAATLTARMTLEEAYALADEALYSAKSTARGSVVYA